ncbi:MAG: helicase-exonuclease AddAB subunit AddB, partial [Bacilli bacterium]
IMIDGFYQFTPQELEVLRALMKHCPDVKIALTIDKDYDHYLPHELDLFYSTAVTYQQLKKLAEEEMVTVIPPISFSVPPIRFQHQPSLAHIEQFYDHRPIVPYEGDVAVTLSAAVNRRAEVEGVARKVRELVSNNGYRWRDMTILVRDLNPYHDLLESVFKDYDIPLFLDQKRSMLGHPLIEFIRSSLDVVLQNWRYEAVFRCVKTDLLLHWNDPAELQEKREQLDGLENYALAYGVNGSRWTNEQRWVYYRPHSLEEDTKQDVRIEDELNDLRSMIVQPLHGLQQNLKKAKTVRQMCEALYLFLVERDVLLKLDSWRKLAEDEGNLRASREHAQVWKSVIDLLDQLVELMGEESLSLQMFSKLIETGCDSMRFALVPPAIDQVLVGSLDRSRFSNVKCTFVLGANDGILPAKPMEEGLVSESEREQLLDHGIALAPGSKQQLALENFNIYVGLNSASDQLWVSYALADEEGKSLTPSILIGRMKQWYPELKEQLIENDPYEKGEKDQLTYVANPQKTLSYLAVQLRQWLKGYRIAPFWWDVYNWFVAQNDWREKTKAVLSSLFYKNEAKALPQSTSQLLYGDHILTSVSRMERFQSCPYSQFLSHGLRLKERSVYRLEAPDIGQLFHAALKLIDDQLRHSGRDWKSLNKAECQHLAAEVVKAIAPRLQNNILLSSNRHHYIRRKLEQVVGRATTVLSEHAKVSQFSPIGLEIDFGPAGPLPSMQYRLGNGKTMEVVGRIDRVDQAYGSGGMMLRVIDYKSSSTALNLGEVYYGLSLQMLTYLDVLITHSKTWLGEEATPAGVLYFHIHNPMLNKKTALPQDQIDLELFKQFKMKGLVAADVETAQLMDTSMTNQPSSIIPIRLKNDGGFYKHSSVASQEDFGHLRNYVRHHIQDIGTQITDGVIDIRPYKLKKKTACTFCSYKPVCQFDREFEDQDYRSLQAISKEDVLDVIRSKGGEFSA